MTNWWRFQCLEFHFLLKIIRFSKLPPLCVCIQGAICVCVIEWGEGDALHGSSNHVTVTWLNAWLHEFYRFPRPAHRRFWKFIGTAVRHSVAPFSGGRLASWRPTPWGGVFWWRRICRCEGGQLARRGAGTSLAVAVYGSGVGSRSSESSVVVVGACRVLRCAAAVRVCFVVAATNLVRCHACQK